MSRPTHRAHCATGPRPCPWTSCRYHLASDEDRDGRAVVHDIPGPETCALDIAERPRGVREISRILGLPHSTTGDLLKRAMGKLRGPLDHMRPSEPERGHEIPARSTGVVSYEKDDRM